MFEMGIGLLFPVLSLISLIVFIIVLIKQFKHGGALPGHIGQRKGAWIWPTTGPSFWMRWA